MNSTPPVGVKIGKFCVSAPQCDPDNLDRDMAAADTEPLEEALRRHMPKAHGEVLNFAACMFTMTPDNHFVIDTHPRHPQVSTVEICCDELTVKCSHGSCYCHSDALHCQFRPLIFGQL
jgi:sarcosine oxidase gamma subunit